MKVVYQRKNPREPQLVGEINTQVRCVGYAKKYRDVSIKVYDTVTATFEKNDIGYTQLLRVLRKNDYKSKYTLSELNKMEQRLIYEASNWIL